MEIKPGKKRLTIRYAKFVIIITLIVSVGGLLASGFRSNTGQEKAWDEKINKKDKSKDIPCALVVLISHFWG